MCNLPEGAVLERMEQQRYGIMSLEKKLGGLRTDSGVEITSFFGGIDVGVSGADAVSMSRYVPKCKENPNTQVAILAVLADSEERRAAMEDQDVVNNPYVVEVGIAVDDEDRQCIPADVPADAVTLVMVMRYKLFEEAFTQVTMFPPD